MITREQVADLRPGDVVEFRIDSWAEGAAIRGPLATNEYGVLALPIPGNDGGYWVRNDHGHAFDGENRSLTVISRAPRPLYVNHDRTEPVLGDVARNEAGHLRVCQESPYADEPDPRWWGYGIQPYGTPGRWSYCTTRLFRDRGPLRLLVDGETGQVVP